MKGHTSKYLKYALGEILLVVIGILIALQINNWNNQRSEQETLRLFLTEFREELELNIESITQEAKKLEVQLKEKSTLLESKQLDTIPLDTLEHYIETRYISLEYNPTLLRRFENAQISNYGKYDTIFVALQEYYGVYWPLEMESASEHNRGIDKEDDYWCYEQETYEFKFLSSDKALLNDTISRKAELIKQIQSIKVRNMLKSDYRKKLRYKMAFKRKIEFSQNLMHLLDKNLQ